MRPVDSVSWLRTRAGAKADFAGAWSAFKEYVLLPCDEPEQRYGRRVRALGARADGDLLLFESGPGGFDLTRQLALYDDDGEWVEMARVSLSAASLGADEAQFWAAAGPTSVAASTRHPEIDNWVGGAREWCVVVEREVTFAAALAGATTDWAFHN